MANSPQMVQQMAVLLQSFDPQEVTEIFKKFNKMQRAENAKKAHDQKKRAMATFSVNKSHTAKDSIPPNRPLNSWMAFRSYYSPIFKSFQQKEISGFLKELWAADAYKAKWSIIAKAYSTIRDVVPKNKAPLDTFLEIVAPQAGALGRNDYLKVMGWSLILQDDKVTLTRVFEPQPERIPQTYRTTMHSAAQLVNFAAQRNYVSRAVFTRTTNNNGNLAMATTPARSQKFDNLVAQVVTARDTNIKADHASSGPVITQSANNDVEAELAAALTGPYRDVRAEYAVHAQAIDEAGRLNNNAASGPSSSFRQVMHDGLICGADEEYFDAFDPIDSLAFPIFNPNAGPMDACFDITNPGTYLAPASMDNPDEFDVAHFLDEAMFDMTN